MHVIVILLPLHLMHHLVPLKRTMQLLLVLVLLVLGLGVGRRGGWEWMQVQVPLFESQPPYKCCKRQSRRHLV
jgi:hypothetical protein